MPSITIDMPIDFESVAVALGWKTEYKLPFSNSLRKETRTHEEYIKDFILLQLKMKCVESDTTNIIKDAVDAIKPQLDAVSDKPEFNFSKPKGVLGGSIESIIG